MNEAEKERLIKKDIANIENRVRHAFNQGYEMGAKESRSEIPNTCGDAISRQAVFEQIAEWIISGEYGFTNATDYLSKKIKALPSVTPQQRTGRWIDAEVLDKIRAEIEQEYEYLSATRDETLELGECLGLKMSLKIIDKYKAESEDKE